MTLTQINKAGLDEIALDHVFTIGASGSSAYTFQGEGLNGTVNNPTLYLTRGKTYRFENGSGGHPIRIQSTSGASGTAYNTGVTNNAGSGTVIVEVQHDAPDVLYYQCTSHAAMNGILYITGALADGGVTTAKLANNAVTTAKIADFNITTAKLATNSVDHAKIVDANVTTAKIQDNAVTTAKIAADAVTSAKIADDVIGAEHIIDNSVQTAAIQDQAVTLAKLPHGTSSTAGKFLRANNGADPTFETVNTDLVSDTSPQLGGDLASNGHDIKIADATGYDGNNIYIGSDNDTRIIHDGSNFSFANSTGNSIFTSAGGVLLKPANGENGVSVLANSAVELYYDNSKRFETSSVGTKFTQATGGVANGSIKVNTDLYNYGSIIVRDQSHSNSTISALEVENNASGTNETNFVLRSVNLGSTAWAHAWYSAKSHRFAIQSNVGGNPIAQIDLDGLKFNGDQSNANALDDYEEGSWTPTGYGFTVATVYSARYTKIGRIVHASTYLQVAAGSGTSLQPEVLGLPYTAYGGNTYSYGTGRMGSAGSNTLSQNNIVWQVQSGSNKAKLYVNDGGVNESMISGQHMIFSVVYEAS